LARHSLHILETIRQYDTFLESLKNVADMGCGTGEDTVWWATLENYNDPPEPYNFNTFAVDRDGSKLSAVPDLPNIKKIQRDFTEPHIFPVNIDLMWAHDCLQCSTDPLSTLKNWNDQMTVNGMLLLTIPQHTGIEYSKQFSRGHSGCYYHYTPIMLIYMLAVNGFDCRDAYLLKRFNDPWVHMAVYKTDIAPMDPKTTTWFDLIDKNLLHPSMVSSIMANGYLKQEEIVMPWLDKELYFIDYISQWEPLRGAPVTVTESTGVFNTTEHSNVHTIFQNNVITTGTQLLKPLPPTRKSYRNK